MKWFLVSSVHCRRRKSSVRVASRGVLPYTPFLITKLLTKRTYPSRDNHPSVKANLKAVQGDLFLLEKYIFFVSKQPSLIELSDIHQVAFSRLGAGSGASAARTFDIKIVTKSGSGDLTFTSVNKEEHETVNGYLQDKKVKTKNEMMEGELILGPDDDEDEEMQSVASSGEEVPKPRRGGDEDDDSEEGASFRTLLRLRAHSLTLVFTSP